MDEQKPKPKWWAYLREHERTHLEKAEALERAAVDFVRQLRRTLKSRAESRAHRRAEAAKKGDEDE